MKRKNVAERNGTRVTLMILFMMFLPLLFFRSSYVSPKNESGTEKETASQSDRNDEDKDPLKLSFIDKDYLSKSDLRNMLSGSEMEYCSHVIEDDESGDLVFTWNLRSDDREIYRCTYTYDEKRTYTQRSEISCRVSAGYQEYLEGDRKLIRDYVMPEKDDGIDMFIYDKDSSYYERYFILGRYSDIKCHVEGDDIYFTYYWYQKTAEGPKLVYISKATNYETTWGQRYNDHLWEAFERSYKNINIVPYDEYQRDHDYLSDYHKWRDQMRNKEKEEELEAMKKKYCVFSESEELFYEYEGDFDSWENAYEFYEKYCD